MTEIIQDLASLPAPERRFDVVERTGLAVATLGSLGLITDVKRATDMIGESMQSLHDSISDSEVSVEPFPSIELTEKFGLAALLKAFDAKQEYQTTVLPGSPWAHYSATELNARQISDDAPSPSEGVSARGMLLGGDDLYGGRSLYYAGKDIAQQIELAAEQQLLTPADYIMLNAQRREAGQHLLDGPTATHFVQLHKKVVNGDRWLPAATSYEKHVFLYGSNGQAGTSGVRLSVG